MKNDNSFAELTEGVKAEEKAENELQELLKFIDIQLAEAKEKAIEATQKAEPLQIEFAEHLLKLNMPVAETIAMTGLGETTILKLT